VLFAGTLGRDEKTKKLLYQGDEQVEVRWPVLEALKARASGLLICF
jgi:hypothetical protein